MYFYIVDYANKPIALKYVDKLQKDNSWLMPDHIHGYKNLHFTQKINDPRLYYSILRGTYKRDVFFLFCILNNNKFRLIDVKLQFFSFYAVYNQNHGNYQLLN